MKCIPETVKLLEKLAKYFSGNKVDWHYNSLYPYQDHFKNY